jgi:DNA-binding Xre family transcriptional regulator
MQHEGRSSYQGHLKVSYNKLWKLLIDKGLSHAELGKQAALASGTLSKMHKGETVSMDTVLKICDVLDCDIADIMEIVSEKQEKK